MNAAVQVFPVMDDERPCCKGACAAPAINSIMVKENGEWVGGYACEEHTPEAVETLDTGGARYALELRARARALAYRLTAQSLAAGGYFGMDRQLELSELLCRCDRTYITDVVVALAQMSAESVWAANGFPDDPRDLVHKLFDLSEAAIEEVESET